MVKYKRYYKRYYRYRYYRRSKWANYNYLAAKLEINDTLAWPQNQGPLYFIGRQNEQVEDWKRAYTIQDLLTSTENYYRLTQVFSYYKIRGIKIEAMPSARNLSNQVNMENVQPIYIGFKLGNNIMCTLEELRSLPQSMMLDPLTRQTRYWGTSGATGEWYSVNSPVAGVLQLGYSQNGTPQNSPIWTFKITLYCVFKRTKV